MTLFYGYILNCTATRQERRKTAVGVTMQTVDSNVHSFWTAVAIINPFLVNYECLVVSWKQFSIPTHCIGLLQREKGEGRGGRGSRKKKKGKEKTMWGEVALWKGLEKERKRGLALEKK